MKQMLRKGINNMAISKDRVAKTLSDMIKIKTVSAKGCETAEIDKFHDYVAERFPNIKKQCDVKNIDGGFMIRWQGENKELPPLVLMSHADVAPANEKEWSFPPFCGEIKDGKILGRGAADTKGSLAAIFEAVDSLIADGYTPKADVYVLSSSREEIAGDDAPKMAEIFKRDKITPGLLVDEGGAILKRPMGGVEGEYAMIAMSECGFSLINVDGDDTNVEKAFRAIEKAEKGSRLTKNVFPAEVEELFRRMSLSATGFMKFVFSHFDALKPILLRIIPKINSMAASMVRPRIGFITSEGEKKIRISFNYYVDIETAENSVVEILAKNGCKGTIIERKKPPKPEDYNSSGMKLVEKTVHDVFPDVYTTPFIIFGGTDARHFVGVANSVIRFAPLKMDYKIISSVHKEDEYIFEESPYYAALFYEKLVRNYDESL